VVNAKIDELRETDFIPFKRLNDLPCAMTAHVVFNDIDAKKCATISKNVIKNIIRKEIGFKGVLFSDDLSMRAHSDDPAKNATNALKAGCDLAVHCNGTLEERYSVLKTVKSLKEAEEHRLKAIFAKRRTPMEINEEKLYAWLIDVVKEYE